MSNQESNQVTVAAQAARKAKSFQLLNRSAMAIVVTASLVVGTFGLGTAAEARVNGPRLDSLSAGCGILQDEADGLRAEYANPNTSNARRGEILDRLRVIGGQWNDICRGVFGDISYLVVDPDAGKTGVFQTAAVQDLSADPSPSGSHGHFEGIKAGKLNAAGLRAR